MLPTTKYHIKLGSDFSSQIQSRKQLEFSTAEICSQLHPFTLGRGGGGGSKELNFGIRTIV